MYEAYWKLACRPFDDGAETKFYYAGQSHETCLLKLRYLIQQRKGAALIVGEHGTGKSYLTHVLEHENDEDRTKFVRLVVPQLSAFDLLRYFAKQLGIEAASTASTNETLHLLEHKLREIAASGTHLVFVVDEAHLLSQDHLNVVRLLLNLREEHRADFSFLLAGRVELLAQVRRHHALDQRISVRTSVSPLSVSEVREYVSERTRVAGADREIFHPMAAQTLWELSAGIPRRVNQLCDLALLVGFADQLQTLGPLEIRTASEEILSVAA